MEEPVQRLCPKHHQQLNLFCTECEETICPNCLLYHKKHEILPINDAVTEISKEIEKRDAGIQAKQQEILNYLDKEEESGGSRVKKVEKQMETILVRTSQVRNRIEEEEIDLVTAAFRSAETASGDRQILNCRVILLKVLE